MNELKRYEDFQRAVFEGAEEAARLDQEPEPAFIPYGRCPRHPGEVISNGMFDGLCGICEAEMAEE
jgi:hypothetical protein